MRTTAAISLAVAVMAAGCTRETDEPTPAKEQPAKLERQSSESQLTTVILTEQAELRLGIELGATEVRSIPVTRTHGGEVVVPPGARRKIVAALAGTIRATDTNVRLEAGLPVEEGEALFAIEPLLAPDARANLEAALSRATGEVARAQARLDAAQVAYDRALAVFAEGAGSARARDDARGELASARADLQSAQASLGSSARSVTGLDDGSANVVVRAPFAGIIEAIHASQGQQVPAGASLLEVESLDHLWIRVPVYAGEATSVDLTKPVEVRTLDLGPDEPGWTGNPVVAPPAANPAASTVDLFYSVDNTRRLFRPGERVWVDVEMKGGERRTLVPWSSVVFDAHGGAWVYERVDTRAYERRRVDILRVQDDFAVLEHGPPAGTAVVTTGAAELFGTEFGTGK